MNEDNQINAVGKQYEALVTITDDKRSGLITINQDGIIVKVGDEEETILYSSIESSILTLENEVKIILLTGEDIVISIGNNEILLNAIESGIGKIRNNDNLNSDVYQSITKKKVQVKSKGKLIIRLILVIGVVIMLNKLLNKETSNEINNAGSNEPSCNDYSYFYAKARSELLYRFSRESNVSINKCGVSKDNELGMGLKYIFVSCEVTYDGISFPRSERMRYSCS